MGWNELPAPLVHTWKWASVLGFVKGIGNDDNHWAERREETSKKLMSQISHSSL